jgi:hypothetical protein
VATWARKRLTVFRRSPSEEPVDVSLVAGSHAGAEATADELQELGLEAVDVRELPEASHRHAPRVGRLRKAQPSRHHRVDPVASDQHLKTQSTSSCQHFHLECCLCAYIGSMCRPYLPLLSELTHQASCKIVASTSSWIYGHNLGRAADGASWLLLLQGLQQRVSPNATDFVRFTVSDSDARSCQLIRK